MRSSIFGSPARPPWAFIRISLRGGDSNEPESRSSFRAVPVLAHQNGLAVWKVLSYLTVLRSGLAALLRVPRCPAHGSAGAWNVCRLACHCELFHKTGIARGRDEQRCFRRVQNYFGVLREKELFERPFLFSPQASPAEHLQVIEQFEGNRICHGLIS